MKDKQAGSPYDRLSRFYHWVERFSEAAPRRAGLNMLNAQPGETVLELGPGTGSALAELARAVSPGGFAAGIDLSPGMLARAARRVPASAGLLRGDARSLPFGPAYFDAIFASFTVELSPEVEIAGVLSECHRVLRPGGRLQVVCLGMGKRKARMRRLYEWFHQRFPAFIDCRPIEASTFMRQAKFSIAASDEISLYGIPVEIIMGIK